MSMANGSVVVLNFISGKVDAVLVVVAMMVVRCLAGAVVLGTAVFPSEVSVLISGVECVIVDVV